ncbi:AP2/ERF and B3 domain-containing protein [Salix suchowensis]|nr:AP2/ERF and B3 domain-containing protein [Salix suchowensis]
MHFNINRNASENKLNTTHKANKIRRSSKVLRKTDIKKRYSVPTGFLSPLPPFNGGHAVDFQAVDGSGRVWPFRCSVRKKGHPKPVISKGWRAFVHSKSLKVGDKVQF